MQRLSVIVARTCVVCSLLATPAYVGAEGSTSGQNCNITINDPASVPMRVLAFETKGDQDYLEINGKSYSTSAPPEYIRPTGHMLSSSSVAGSRWMLCPVYFAPGAMWAVISGSCTVDDELCLSSPNYPQHYGHSEHCTIAINPSEAGHIEVRAFDTEARYDVLTVDGVEYSGSAGPTDIVPRHSITWRADSSKVRPGWRLCRSSQKCPIPMWSVESGSCTVDCGGCLRSPNYPNNYRNSQSCRVHVASASSAPIQVEAFNTEQDYDFLTVNGAQYDGGNGPQGVRPHGWITWCSDGSETDSGWKLCPSWSPSAQIWSVRSGDCRIDDHQCAMSPDFLKTSLADAAANESHKLEQALESVEARMKARWELAPQQLQQEMDRANQSWHVELTEERRRFHQQVEQEHDEFNEERRRIHQQEEEQHTELNEERRRFREQLRRYNASARSEMRILERAMEVMLQERRGLAAGKNSAAEAVRPQAAPVAMSEHEEETHAGQLVEACSLLGCCALVLTLAYIFKGQGRGHDGAEQSLANPLL